MKKEYQIPEIQVTERVGVDVITASPTTTTTGNGIDNDYADNWTV